MEVRARARFVRVSPQKTRLVAANIKRQPVEVALNILKFSPQKAAQELYKVLYAAVANAEHTSSLDVDELFVKNVLVDEGPSMKRIKPRAMGRATRIVKRTSHLTVIVDEI